MGDEMNKAIYRCGIYIDWLNIKEAGGRNLSFDKLLAYVRGQGGFVRVANIYVPPADENQIPFYDAIRQSGFRAVIVPEKTHFGSYSVIVTLC